MDFHTASTIPLQCLRIWTWLMYIHISNASHFLWPWLARSFPARDVLWSKCDLQSNRPPPRSHGQHQVHQASHLEIKARGRMGRVIRWVRSIRIEPGWIRFNDFNVQGWKLPGPWAEISTCHNFALSAFNQKKGSTSKYQGVDTAFKSFKVARVSAVTLSMCKIARAKKCTWLATSTLTKKSKSFNQLKLFRAKLWSLVAHLALSLVNNCGFVDIAELLAVLDCRMRPWPLTLHLLWIIRLWPLDPVPKNRKGSKFDNWQVVANEVWVNECVVIVAGSFEWWAREFTTLWFSRSLKFDYFCQMIVEDTFPQDHGCCPRCSQESALAAMSWQWEMHKLFVHCRFNVDGGSRPSMTTRHAKELQKSNWDETSPAPTTKTGKETVRVMT